MKYTVIISLEDKIDLVMEVNKKPILEIDTQFIIINNQTRITETNSKEYYNKING